MRVLVCLVVLCLAVPAIAADVVDAIAVEAAVPDAVVVGDPGIWPAIGVGVGATIGVASSVIAGVSIANDDRDHTGLIVAMGGAMFVLPVLGAVLGAVAAGVPDTALPAAGGALLGEATSTCVCGCVGFGVGSLLVGWIPLLGPFLVPIAGGIGAGIATLVGFVPITALGALIATEVYRGVPVVLGLLNPTAETAPAPAPAPAPVADVPPAPATPPLAVDD